MTDWFHVSGQFFFDQIGGEKYGKFLQNPQTKSGLGIIGSFGQMCSVFAYMNG